MRGGKREGAGRKRGTPNKATQERCAKVAASGITPLDYMLELMRAPIPEDATPEVKLALQNQKFEAAKAAAPYCHAKLSAIEMTGKNGKDLVPAMDQTALARRVAFMLTEAAIKKAKEPSHA